MKLRYKLPLLFAILLFAYLSITALLALICYPDPDIEVLKCFAQRLDLPGLKRAARINENFYRGAMPTRDGLASLKKLGVKTIIDLDGFFKEYDYPREVRSLGLNYFLLPLADKPPSAQTVEEFLSIVTDPRNCPVFLHCWRGKVRTGVMTAIYRIRCDEWKNEDAFNEMLYFGFSIFHRETFFFGSREVHTVLADFVKNYRPPEKNPPEQHKR